MSGPLSRKLGHVMGISGFYFNFYRPKTGLLELNEKTRRLGKFVLRQISQVLPIFPPIWLSLVAGKVLKESRDDSDLIDVGLDQDFGQKAHQISRRSAIESRYGSNTVISVSETNYRSIRQKLFCLTRDLLRGGIPLA